MNSIGNKPSAMHQNILPSASIKPKFSGFPIQVPTGSLVLDLFEYTSDEAKLERTNKTKEAKQLINYLKAFQAQPIKSLKQDGQLQIGDRIFQITSKDGETKKLEAKTIDKKPMIHLSLEFLQNIIFGENGYKVKLQDDGKNININLAEQRLVFIPKPEWALFSAPKFYKQMEASLSKLQKQASHS